MRFAEPDPMDEESSDRRAFPALGSQRPDLPVPEVPVSFAESATGGVLLVRRSLRHHRSLRRNDRVSFASF